MCKLRPQGQAAFLVSKTVPFFSETPPVLQVLQAAVTVAVTLSTMESGPERCFGRILGMDASRCGTTLGSTVPGRLF